MEAAGLGVGIVALAGLFKTCLEILEQADSYRKFDSDARFYTTRFSTQKSLFGRWAGHVGIVGDKLKDEHHVQLDDSSVASEVRRIFLCIHENFDLAESMSSGPALQSIDSQMSSIPNKGDFSKELLVNFKSQSSAVSKRKRAAWTFGGKDSLIKQVQRFESLVTDLYQLIPLDDQSLSRFDELIGMGDKVDGIGDILRGFQKNQGTLISTSEQRERLLRWLDAVFTDEEYETALSFRLDKTCDWFLQKPEFKSWVTPCDETRLLWIRGPPGFGKTILCARLIQHLRENLLVPISAFFCVSENDTKRRPQSIIRSWVAQLVLQHDAALEVVWEVYNEKQFRPTTESDLWGLFRRIVLKIPNCAFVVDGFDECVKVDSALGSFSIDVRIRFLQQLLESAEETGASILLMSRDDADIRSQLRDNSHKSTSIIEYDITGKDTKEDVGLLAQSIMTRKLPNKPKVLKEEMAGKAAEKSDGMFLWVRLLDRRLTPGKNAKQLRQIVSERPAGLEHTYERELEAILKLDSDDRDRAIAILRWVVFAVRPLTVRELTEALLVDDDSDDDDASNTFPSEDLPDAWDEDYVNDQIRRLCGSLLDLRWDPKAPGSFAAQTVHFIHFSAKEFLYRAVDVNLSPTETIRFSDAASENYLLARVCLKYLCYNDFRKEGQLTKEVLELMMSEFQFFKYAAKYWPIHASDESEWPPSLRLLAYRLLDPTDCRWATWGEILEPSQPSIDDRPNPLYYASLLGLDMTTEWLQAQGLDVNAKGGVYGNPLQAAVVGLSMRAVRFLLEHEANVNAQGGLFCTAIAAATVIYPPDLAVAIMRLLLEFGADISIRDSNGQTPLLLAADYGTAGRWLKQRTEVGIVSAGNHLHAFPDASYQSPLPIVKLLIEYGADVNAKDNNEWTALHKAAPRGYYSTVKLLLEHEADVNAKDNDEWTPLHFTVCGVHDSTVKLLIEYGADVNAKDEKKRRALHFAVVRGYDLMIKLLLEHGADIKIPEEDDEWAVLHLAAKEGHDSVVKLLLEHGVDINFSEEGYGWTALHDAADRGHDSTVKLLLEHGADVNAKDKIGWTALHYAAQREHDLTVKLLLEHGAEVNLVNEERTILHLAAIQGHDSVVKILLEHGGDVNLKVDGWTALHLTAVEGHDSVVKLLLEHGADANPEVDRWTALHLAAIQGHDLVVKLLLEHGADANSEVDGWTALRDATDRKHHAVVELLLKFGAKPGVDGGRDSIEVHPEAVRNDEVEKK